MRTPGPYLREDKTIYVLEQIGFQRFQNRVYADFWGGPNTPKEEVEATAEFFQRAANCHDDLVAALELAVKRCGDCGGTGTAYTMEDEESIGQHRGSSAIDCPGCWEYRQTLAAAKATP